MQGANSNHYNFAIIPCNSLENCVVGVGMTKKSKHPHHIQHVQTFTVQHFDGMTQKLISNR